MSTAEKIYIIFMYGFLGLVLDSGVRLLRSGELYNGTLLRLPWSPMYALGAVGILLLHRVIGRFHLFWQFCIYGVLLASYEYFGGVATEYFFGKRLWDYSDLPLHFDGHTTFGHAIMWGVLALLLVHKIHPNMIMLFEYTQRWTRRNELPLEQ